MQTYSYRVWGEDLPTLNYVSSTWKADNFKFTGKENLQGTGFIDFGARWYDNIVPRFTTIDPLSELSRRFSPMVYGNDNPVMMVDPDGMKSVWNGKFGSESGYNDDVTGESRSWKDVQGEYGMGDIDKGKQTLPTAEQAKNRGSSNGLNPSGDGVKVDYTLDGAYIGGKIFKPVVGFFGGIFGKSVWSQNPYERGREIESILGGNLPGNFPVIDKFVNGVATSIKSVDLTSASYQSASGLKSLLTGYVKSLSGFSGRSWAGAQVGTNATNQILSRTLEIAIPRGSVTATQQTVMNQIVQNSLSATNPVTVKFIPL